MDFNTQELQGAAMAKPYTLSMPQLWQALRELQASWNSGDWAGLPTVVSGCLRTMGYTPAWTAQQRGVLRQFMKAIDVLAHDVERVGHAMQQANTEPAYHNRKHMGQVVASMAALLLARRASNTMSTTEACQELTLVAAALGHDVLHDGRRNVSLRQAELLSARYVKAILKKSGLGAHWCARVASIIELTDPIDAINNHAFLLDKHGLDDLVLCCVLTNEADIVASSLPDIGADLTEDLATEWDQRYPTDAQGLRTPGGRIFFLKQLALFSSESSKRLGLPGIRQAQLEALGAV
ncbi:3',5'-cyclic nucleotide phosphodiesterase [Comamonadaceae bacterium M7527]|nr:3',5'-cyclic nucleotide phosphodiesterase [Comamonadaceae bacterium M7527]